ncbi:hypothetical protein [Nocardia tengchongensis]|uniref:hypothetical protein n=1 Tax=Nocardia tengchongensis TaxID=2055889 RepID=UPI003681DC23
MAEQTPSIGRVVHYTLTADDAKAINADLARNGNRVAEGDIFPAMIVRVFQHESANLQVFLDGDDSFWATSRTLSDGAGHWNWPPRV